MAFKKRVSNIYNLKIEELITRKLKNLLEIDKFKAEELKYGSESDLQREQQAKYSFFGLKEGNHTNL